MAGNIAPTSILSLNDDCLYLILSKLPILKVIEIEKVCLSFKRVAQMIYQTQQVLDFHKISNRGCRLTPMQARTVASRVGPHVHTLKASKESFSMLRRVVPKSILMYCKNLQKIFLFDLRMTDKGCIKRLTATFANIKEVHLVDSNFTDDIGACLRNSSQLEVIRFTNNTEITGLCLTGLQGIKVINLARCTKLQPKFFKDFLMANLQLRSINISGCPDIDAACLDVIATKLIHLEKLEIYDKYKVPYEAYRALANLPNLTSMRISYSIGERIATRQVKGLLPELSIKAHDRLEELRVHAIDLTATDLEALIRFTRLRILDLSFIRPITDNILFSLSCKDTLEELDVSGCDDLTPQDLLEFIKQLKSLKRLEISSCRQFTMEFLKDLAAILDQKLVLVARLSFYSSTACDQYELTELLENIQDKIELRYKHMLKDDEYPPSGRMWISRDQIIFQ